MADQVDAAAQALQSLPVQPSNEAPKKRMVKRKPARQQCLPGQHVKRVGEQTGQIYNIWHGRWEGGDYYDNMKMHEKSETRLVVATDAGYTRADSSGETYYCVEFARGRCSNGAQCQYLHRVPVGGSSIDISRDVFSREKASEYKDDMSGVGSFSRTNRTLYVGRIKETRTTAEMVERHFEEFGEIERIRILQSRGVAFVTYYSELSAQFAKEAMTDQSLDSEEVINVRWANEDPNPTAIKAEARHLKKLGEKGIGGALDPEFVQAVRVMDELEGLVQRRIEEPQVEDDRAGKRARIEAPVEQPLVARGLLSAGALGSLKNLAAMNSAALRHSAAVSKAVATVGGLGGLADYGSDDE